MKLKLLAFFALMVFAAVPSYGIDTSVGVGSGGGGASLNYFSSNLPDTIAVATEREMNIWNNQLGFQFPGIEYFGVVQFCDVGGVRSRSYRYVPSAASSDVLDINIKDPGHKTIASSSVVLKAVANDGGGSESYNVMFIGDSLISAGQIASVVDSLGTTDGGADITLVGLRGTGTAKHTGIGGWEYSGFTTDYTDSDGNHNPFWIGGKLDFQQFSTDSLSGVDLDYVVINLGLNDSANSTDPSSAMTSANIQAIVDDAKTLVDAIQDETDGYPDCKVIIGIEPTSSWDMTPLYTSNNGWDYRYWTMVTMQKLSALLISIFDGYAYNDNVDVCHAGLWVDRTWGYPFTTADVSARVTDDQITEVVNSNLIHPSYIGYQQMADAYYSHLRWWMIKDMPAGANELADSWDIRDASDCWTVAGSMTTTGSQSGVTGSDAVRLTSANGSAYSYAYLDGGVITATSVVVSAIFKDYNMANGQSSDFILYNITDSSKTDCHTRVTWDGAGVPTVNSSGGTVSDNLTSLGSGWYRLEFLLDFTTASRSGKQFRMQVEPWYSGSTIGQGIYLDGLQVELDVSEASTYIKTTCP